MTEQSSIDKPRSARILLWQLGAQGALHQRPVARTAVLGASDQQPEEAAAPRLASGPVVQAIEPVGEAIAMLLVAPRWAHAVSRHGEPLPAGVHALRHADHLEYDGVAYWVSQQTAAQAVPYDPAVHGHDVFCYLVKARLQPGQLCVVCPGTPGNPCNAIYKLESWQAISDAESPLRCANCGYRPGAADWQPTLPGARKQGRDANELLALLRK